MLHVVVVASSYLDLGSEVLRAFTRTPVTLDDKQVNLLLNVWSRYTLKMPLFNHATSGRKNNDAVPSWTE